MKKRRMIRQTKRQSRPKVGRDVLKILLNKAIMIERVKSRKLWVAVLSAALVAFGDGMGLSQVTQWIIGMIGGLYTVGQGIADGGKQGELQALAAEQRQMQRAAAASRKQMEAEARQAAQWGLQPQGQWNGYPPQGNVQNTQGVLTPNNQQKPQL